MMHRQDHSGFPIFEIMEDSMDHYFVIDTTTEVIERIVQRTKGSINPGVSGKRFMQADGVMMKFYYTLSEVADEVTLTDVMHFVRR